MSVNQQNQHLNMKMSGHTDFVSAALIVNSVVLLFSVHFGKPFPTDVTSTLDENLFLIFLFKL